MPTLDAADAHDEPARQAIVLVDAVHDLSDRLPAVRARPGRRVGPALRGVEHRVDVTAGQAAQPGDPFAGVRLDVEPGGRLVTVRGLSALGDHCAAEGRAAGERAEPRLQVLDGLSGL